MAKQIEGVYETVLECARQEFLEKGFKDASLRTIAAKANTSTGSIYTRFHDKEGLFREIVNPVAVGLKESFLNIQENFHDWEAEKQTQDMDNYAKNSLTEIIDYIYDHFLEFDLMINGSYGTEFSDFIDEIVDIESDYTLKYMEVIECNVIKDNLIVKNALHIIITAYINGIFEIVRHKMKKEDAKKYIDILYKYHRRGFDVFFQENDIRI